jgi:hypothetical protein
MAHHNTIAIIRDNVTSDAEVVEEAINEYAEELKENASRAAAGVARGDFSEVLIVVAAAVADRCARGWEGRKCVDDDGLGLTGSNHCNICHTEIRV